MSATRPYRPSNGCEGMDFIEHFCGRCKHDIQFRKTGEGEGCKIVSDSFLYERDDPRYPKEWVQDVPWGNARCTAFEEEKP